MVFMGSAITRVYVARYVPQQSVLVILYSVTCVVRGRDLIVEQTSRIKSSFSYFGILSIFSFVDSNTLPCVKYRDKDVLPTAECRGTIIFVVFTRALLGIYRLACHRITERPTVQYSTQ